MAQQTAVEWLIKRYHDYGNLYYEDMTKAKAMEKEQIINAVLERTGNLPPKLVKEKAEQYYNDTYGK